MSVEHLDLDRVVGIREHLLHQGVRRRIIIIMEAEQEQEQEQEQEAIMEDCHVDQIGIIGSHLRGRLTHHGVQYLAVKDHYH
jgi:hypothetical protein